MHPGSIRQVCLQADPWLKLHGTPIDIKDPLLPAVRRSGHVDPVTDKFGPPQLFIVDGVQPVYEIQDAVSVSSHHAVNEIRGKLLAPLKPEP